MKLMSANVVSGVLVIFVCVALPLCGQDTNATLSGTITDASGKPVANVSVSVKNVTTGQVAEALTDASGHYSVRNLAPGDYEVTGEAEGLGASAVKVSVPAEQTANLTLGTAQQAPGATPPPAPSENLPSAPVPNKTEPSLSDLGFSPAESQANAREQALLDKRTHMLKIHQRMGLITAGPLLATVITSINAGGKSEGTASRDLHVALGALTGDLYGITAYYAIRAPRIPGTETRGPIKVHKILAWVHGPGMILTPILGAMAFNQKNNGEKVHGIASAHGPVAIVTAGAFGAALLAVSVKF
ncbi:MAG: carboxypeptidase-like regulatory domain-containing protein [Candidatus Sulfotelmatobacter sp.]